MAEEPEDEDIVIDFSKVTKLFKGKKKGPKKQHKKTEAQETEESSPKEENAQEQDKPAEDPAHHPKKEHPPAEDDDDEISVDFSKVTAFFKRKGTKKKAADEEKDEEDAVQIDWKQTANWVKKHALVLLILIPIILSVGFRIQPASLPATDNWATDTVNNYFRNQVAQQVNQQYPNLPQANKDSIIKEQFAHLSEQQQANIDQQITAISQQFKDQLRDESGQTYLLAIDPYFWERLSRNVIENGYSGDVKKDGVVWDNHMLAPNGREMPRDVLHAYVQAYIYKFVRIFNKDIPLKNVAFYIPVLLATLAVIPAFFLGRRLGGNVGGLFASILIAVHSQFLTRTAAGFADTDAYSVTLPLFIVWAFIEAFEAKEWWKKATLTSISGFLVGVFAFSWTGAWYIFDIIIGSMGIFAIYLFIKQYLETRKINLGKFLSQPAIKNTIYLFLIFFVVSGVFVTIFRDFDTFTGSFVQGPLTFAEFKDVGTKVIWPNVYTTVAEQNPSSLPGVISAMGGKMLFFLAILGALLAVIKTDKDGNRDIKMAAILIIWMGVSTFAAVRGIRFSLLIVPAFSVGFGLFIGITYQYVANWMHKELKINKILTGAVLLVIFSLLLIGPVRAGWNVAKNEVPSMNDGWFNSLDRIRQASPEDAIVNSWWDFGHWFKNIADRPVTFDGTSQNTPQAHWIGKVLLTDDEDEAVGILRMLDCNANGAFEELKRLKGDSLEAVTLLYKIIPEHDAKTAKNILTDNGLTSQEADTVLKSTHCVPPQNYFIVSEDMIGKSGVWAHFGSWDFRKSAMYLEAKGLEPGAGIATLKDRFNLSDQEAQNVYYDIQVADPNQWIAPWPSYASGLSSCSAEGENLRCANGILINRSRNKWQAYVPSPTGNLYAKVFAYPTKDDMEQVTHEGDNIIRTTDGRDLGITLVPNGNGYQILLMSPELVASMFTRLFYLDAHGLKHFKLFSYEQTFSGGQIYVYNVSWKPGEMSLVQELRPKTEVKEGYTVSINYIGWDDTGTVFDTTIQDAEPSELSPTTTFDEWKSFQPFTFTVGQGQVITGMDQQIRGMKKGEEKLMTIPPDQGYGSDPTKHPLGNKTLTFRVRVEDIT